MLIHVRNEEKPNINEPNFCLMLEKEVVSELVKVTSHLCVLEYVHSKKRNKVSRRKNIIKATAEINEIQKLSQLETKSKVSPLKRLVN